jgi:CRP-like cAMP-binding protein
MNASKQVQLLLSNLIFKGLTPVDAKALFGAGQVLSYKAGSKLFSQGDIATSLCLVLDGAFQVQISSSTDETRTLATISPGEVIGEVALLRSGKRSATLLAAVDSVIWKLPSEVFEGLLERGDPMAGRILHGISNDLCRRFREVVYEGAALMGRMAPKNTKRIYDAALEWEL